MDDGVVVDRRELLWFLECTMMARPRFLGGAIVLRISNYRTRLGDFHGSVSIGPGVRTNGRPGKNHPGGDGSPRQNPIREIRGTSERRKKTSDNGLCTSSGIGLVGEYRASIDLFFFSLGQAAWLAGRCGEEQFHYTVLGFPDNPPFPPLSVFPDWTCVAGNLVDIIEIG